MLGIYCAGLEIKMKNDNNIKILFLSQEDTIKAGVLNMHECIKVIEEAFELLACGDCIAGGPLEHDHGIKVWFPSKPRGINMPTMGPDRRFMAMVGYLGGRFNICGTKWYGSNAKNKIERNLPRSILLIIINDPVSGKPLSIMDGTLISAMRTGAVPGIAAKYLAKEDSKTIGIIGAGMINRTSFMSLNIVLKNIKEVKIYDVKYQNSIDFRNYIHSKYSIKKVYTVDSVENAVQDADVVSVATSGKEVPLIKDNWLKKNSCIILSGGVQSDDHLYQNSNIIFDDWKMHCIWALENEERKKIEPQDTSYETFPVTIIKELLNEGKISKSDITSIYDIILNKMLLKKLSFEKNIFISGGLPMEDLAWSYTIYQNASSGNIGKELSLWDTPYFFS